MSDNLVWDLTGRLTFWNGVVGVELLALCLLTDVGGCNKEYIYNESGCYSDGFK